MNWLGWNGRALFGAVLGALAGAAVFAWTVALGAPTAWLVWTVGALAGLGAALFADEKSGLRGVFVASMAAWTAAGVEVFARPATHSFVDLATGLARLHYGLTPLELGGHLAGVLLALLLGGLSLRRGALRRLPGA